MARVLMIIAQIDFQPVEFKGVKEEIVRGGHEVKIASMTTDVCVGKDGLEVIPDLSIDSVLVEDYDAVVVIGGPGATGLSKYDSVLSLLKQFNLAEKVIGAICIAPTVLAVAGVLEGKKAAVWNKDSLQEKVLNNYGAEYLDSDIVIDGKIVTANGPDVSHEFGQKLVEVINNQ